MPRLQHTQKMLEATLTQEQAIAYAEKWCSFRRGRRFTRRFRVEETRVGNSYLVTKKRARELAGLYGGKIVELIPPPPPRMTLFERAAADNLPPCPVCKAERGKPCISLGRAQTMGQVNRAGYPRSPHKRRVTGV